MFSEMRVTRYYLYSSTQSLYADSGYTHVFFRVPRCSQSRLCMSRLPPCLWEELQFHWLSLSESMLHIGTQQSRWHQTLCWLPGISVRKKYKRCGFNCA